MVLLFLYLGDRQVNYLFHRLKFNDVYFIHIILAQGIALPFFIQENAAKVGMVVKPDTEHIVGLPFMKFGSSPYITNRVEAGIDPVIGLHLENDGMLVCCGIKMIYYGELLTVIHPA